MLLLWCMFDLILRTAVIFLADFIQQGKPISPRLLFQSSLNDEFDMIDYLQVLVPYVLQKAFDFSEWSYEAVKQKIGKGVLVDYVIEGLVIKERGYPKIADIVENAKDYIGKLEMNK